jgi:hypothetical protein
MLYSDRVCRFGYLCADLCALKDIVGGRPIFRGVV